MRISVIIPSYKPQDYLWECLNSLLSQTVPPTDFEIIIVLNGCCEPYLTAIKKFVSDHNIANARIIQTDQGGVSNARNMAIDCAKGDFITFIDDDDYVSETYLEALLAKAKDGVVPVSNVVAFDDSSRESLPSYLTDCFQRISSSGSVSLFAGRSFMSVPWAKLLDRRIIGSNRFSPQFAIGEDSLFMFQISRNMSRLQATSPDAIYYRRVRSLSASMSQHGYWNRTRNNLLLIKAFTTAYCKGITRYDFLLYASRVIARLGKIAKDSVSLS